MKLLWQRLVCIFWEGQHDWHQYGFSASGYKECQRCKAYEDTFI